MARYLKIKGWTDFQHYKDRNPPWIKLHRTLLDDYEFSCLHDASKAHLMLIWLFASQHDGAIPDDQKFLMKKLGLESEPNLKLFIDHGFLIPEQDASNAQAQDASKVRLETEAYKEETEKTLSGKPDRKPEAVQVLEYLNEKTGRAYEAVDANVRLILGRFKDGSSVEDCKAVIDRKCEEWLRDEEMQKFLRPATLFNATKFAQYRGEVGGQSRQMRPDL